MYVCMYVSQWLRTFASITDGEPGISFRNAMKYAWSLKIRFVNLCFSVLIEAGLAFHLLPDDFFYGIIDIIRDLLLFNFLRFYHAAGGLLLNHIYINPKKFTVLVKPVIPKFQRESCLSDVKKTQSSSSILLLSFLRLYKVTTKFAHDAM